MELLADRTMTYVPVDLFDLGLAATLVVINGALSLALQLGYFANSLSLRCVWSFNSP